MTSTPDTALYICCDCSPDSRIGERSRVLERRICAKHGETWHVEATRLDGDVPVLAYPRPVVAAKG